MSAEGTPRVKGMAVTAASYPSSPGCLDGRFHELRGTVLVWDTPDATIVLGQDIIQPARRTLPTPTAPHPAPSIHASHGINHHPSRSAASRAAAVGLSPPGLPRACSACCLPAAVPDEPEMMAPAWPMVLPAGAWKPAMYTTTGLLTCASM